MGIDPNLRWEADSSTRYLCVGAEIDSDFAHEVIEAVLEERYQAVAPSFGIDLVPVVRHALNGRRRRTTRDLTVAALAAVNLLLNPVGSVATVVAGLVTQFFYRRARLRWPQWGTRNALAVGAIAYATIGALLGLMVVLPAAALGVAAGTSSPGLARLLTSLLRIASIGSVLSLLAVWGVVLWERLATRSVLVDTLRWDTYDPARRSVRVDLDPRAQQRLQVIDEMQRRHNVTAYSGFFPFLGAGGELRTWSFGIDLTRGTPGFAMDGQRPDGQQPLPFTIAELQAHVAQRLEALRSPDLDPAHRLGGLIVEDRLFIHGTHVWRDGRFLPDAWRPPLAWVEPAVLARIGDEPGGVVGSRGRAVGLPAFRHRRPDALRRADRLPAPADQDQLSNRRRHDPEPVDRGALRRALGDVQGGAGGAAPRPGRALARLALQAPRAQAGQPAPGRHRRGAAGRLRRQGQRTGAGRSRQLPDLVPAARRGQAPEGHRAPGAQRHPGFPRAPRRRHDRVP